MITATHAFFFSPTAPTHPQTTRHAKSHTRSNLRNHAQALRSFVSTMPGISLTTLAQRLPALTQSEIQHMMDGLVAEGSVRSRVLSSPAPSLYSLVPNAPAAKNAPDVFYFPTTITLFCDDLGMQ